MSCFISSTSNSEDSTTSNSEDSTSSNSEDSTTSDSEDSTTSNSDSNESSSNSADTNDSTSKDDLLAVTLVYNDKSFARIEIARNKAKLRHLFTIGLERSKYLQTCCQLNKTILYARIRSIIYTNPELLLDKLELEQNEIIQLSSTTSNAQQYEAADLDEFAKFVTMSSTNQQLLLERMNRKEIDRNGSLAASSLSDQNRKPMLYINVEVNGTQMQALIDCGAEFTLMTSNCVEKCGLSNIIDPEFEMTAVGIGTAKISGRIAFQTIKVAGRNLSASIYVLDLPQDYFIIGLDLLRKYGANINLSSNKLVFLNFSDPFLVTFLDSSLIKVTFQKITWVKSMIKEFKSPTMSCQHLQASTMALENKLRIVESNVSKLLRVQELNSHIVQCPQCSNVAWRDNIVPTLLRMKRDCTNQILPYYLSESAELLGLVDPIEGRGIRILSIDGGDIRGLVVLELMDEMQRICDQGTPIHDLSDNIVGVSTGALIAAKLGGLQLTVEQCKEVYRDVSVKLFSQGRVAGSLGLIRRHSFSDTEQWANILHRTFGETKLMRTVHDRRRWPKLRLISCVAQPKLESFVFRNYAHHPDSQLLYARNVDFPLWPNTPIHCVVFMGTGRIAHLSHEAPIKPAQYSSVVDKLMHGINSATVTEKTHTLLHDLLEPGSYYRLNPYMTRLYTMDDVSLVSLDQMTIDAKMYARKNESKLHDAVKRLTMTRTTFRRYKDALNRHMMLHGLEVL